jgi:hypothetical protein
VTGLNSELDLVVAVITATCLVGGPALIFSGARGLKRFSGRKSWSVAEGRITSSQIQYGNNVYWSDFSYEYSVNGVSYSGRTSAAEAHTFALKRSARGY